MNSINFQNRSFQHGYRTTPRRNRITCVGFWDRTSVTECKSVGILLVVDGNNRVHTHVLMTFVGPAPWRARVHVSRRVFENRVYGARESTRDDYRVSYARTDHVDKLNSPTFSVCVCLAVGRFRPEPPSGRSPSGLHITVSRARARSPSRCPYKSFSAVRGEVDKAVPDKMTTWRVWRGPLTNVSDFPRASVYCRTRLGRISNKTYGVAA